MKSKTKKPGRLAEYILYMTLPELESSFLIGDYEEEFNYLRDKKGTLYANLWYWVLILESIPGFFVNSIIWSTAMFKNYFKIAYRNMTKQKGFTFINISGLAIGIACFLAIFLYVRFEKSYDNYHKDADRIYRVSTKIADLNMPGNRNEFANISGPAAQTIKNNFPIVEKAARFVRRRNRLIQYEDKRFYENFFFYADQELFDIFNIQVIHGNPKNLLTRPGTAVITKDMAQKYFGTENPVGKVIKVNNSDWEITGVINNHPRNTHFKYDFIASLAKCEEIWQTYWTLTVFYTYLKLKTNIDIAFFEKEINDVLKATPGQLRENWTYFLQPLKDIHLKSDLLYEVEPPGNSTNLYIFSIIGILILLIACVNNVNLSKARSTVRAKEVGLRKVIGARREQLIKQFLGESIFTTILAVISAFFLVTLSLPVLSSMTGIDFILSDLFNPLLGFLSD